MKTLLKIDSSLRIKGSHTRKLGDLFVEKWLKENPKGKVINRDVTRNPINHLNEDMINSFNNNLLDGIPSISDVLIDELKSTNTILICAPLYNFTISSGLKAYIDHIVRVNKTFKIENEEYKPILNKDLYIISARSSFDNNGQEDFLFSYLRQVFNFIGVDCKGFFNIEATGYDAERQEIEFNKQKEKLEWCFSKYAKASWVGDFDLNDKIAIFEISQNQASAIVNGNSQQYADICSEDINLMLPFYQFVSGNDNFKEFEVDIFSKYSFTAFEKSPIKIEKFGNIAIEFGYQSVGVESSDKKGIGASEQKYLHIYRKNNDKWKYFFLTSNQV